MVFSAHTTIGVSLIALTLGTFLLLWTCKAELCCKMFGKIVGIVVIVLSILSILCSIYHGSRMIKMEYGMGRMWNEMPGMRGDRPMRKDYPMMKKMMENQNQDNE